MKRYAFAGASGRAIRMYAVPLAKDFADVAELVGVFDVNNKRSEVLKKKTGLDFPVYNGFDEMIKDGKPDTIIVTTVDRYHHDYIIRSLEAGCDVVTEKPMTIDSDKCNAILEAEKRTGKKVIVTFNYRFAPFATRIKELIKQDTIGDILNVHFEWTLDTSHGADYFRRWHRRKENSGGLLVHKSTHHFDLVNWLIEQEPEIVNAFGTRRFYGPTRKERGERCLTCRYKDTCEFYLDLAKNETLKELYLDCEDADGYFRDKCVFADEIDIEDTISVNVKYNKGTLLSYSLTAHSPYEGYKMSLNGSKGRIEAEDIHSDIGLYAGQRIYRLRVYNRQGEEVNYKVPAIRGGHGGGDERLRRMVFRGNTPDPLGHQAGSRAGAMSIITGIAANESIKQVKSIFVKDLLTQI